MHLHPVDQRSLGKRGGRHYYVADPHPAGCEYRRQHPTHRTQPAVQGQLPDQHQPTQPPGRNPAIGGQQSARQRECRGVGTLLWARTSLLSS